MAHSLAVQIKKAVSLELSKEFSFEDHIQGTEGRSRHGSIDTSQPQQKTAAATIVRLASDSSGEDSPRILKTSESVESRRNSDLTPGGVIDSSVPQILENCRVNESREFVPFFPPGRMLHIQVERSER